MVALDHFQEGWSISQISEATRVRHNTVSRIIARWQCYHTILDRPRIGRPRLLTTRHESRITRVALRNPFISTREIWDETNTNPNRTIPSRYTIGRILHRSGLFCFRAVRKPLLTKTHRRARVQFVKTHQDMDWTRVIFTDEKRFRLRSDGPRKVWRRKGERQAPQNTTYTTKFGGGSIMVWVAINYDGKLWVRLCNDHMNGVDHLWILESFIDTNDFFEMTRSKQMYLQQDNASPHTTKANLEYLDNIGLRVLKWPSQSPDLNIVEHVWPMISRTMTKTDFNNKEDAWEAIQTACVKLQGSAAIRALYESIPNRMEECLRQRGGPTHY